MGKGRSVVAVLIAATSTFVAFYPGSGLAGGKRTVATLKAGGYVFWNGDRIESSPDGTSQPVPLPPIFEERPEEVCGDDCFEYELKIAESGQRLRVSVDTPDCGDAVSIELFDPHGESRAIETSCYSAELYVRNPEVGMWVVRAIGHGSDPIFRMRAKLEDKGSLTPKRALLPNLRVEPPHDFSFDDRGIGLRSSSCFEEEVVEEGARRCLRFAVGPQNVGLGPLELKFTRDTEIDTDASMAQRIHYSDGTTEMRPAGESEFHKAHGHFHLKGFARFTLLRVLDRRTGESEAVGNGNKAGFCLVDMRIAKWRSFDQARSFTARSNCMPVGGKAEIGLSAGWTDIYGPELSGNYVDVGDNPDGLYVIRVEVDSAGSILEANEADNLGYAFFELKGSDVKLIERGRGSDPWDADKKVARPWWE